MKCIWRVTVYLEKQILPSWLQLWLIMPPQLRQKKKKKKGQVLVGFALETENEKEYALDKLKKKNADMIVLNSLKEEGAGFGHDTNKVTIFEKGGQAFSFPLKSKEAVAKDIVDTIIR